MLPIHKIPFSFNECNNSQHVAKSFHFKLAKAAAQKLMDYRNRNNVQNIFHSKILSWFLLSYSRQWSFKFYTEKPQIRWQKLEFIDQRLQKLNIHPVSWHEISFWSWIQLVKRQRLINFFNGNPFINYLRNTYICLHFCRVFDYIFSPILNLKSSKLYVWHFSLEQTVTSSFCWFGSYILR